MELEPSSWLEACYNRQHSTVSSSPTHSSSSASLRGCGQFEFIGGSGSFHHPYGIDHDNLLPWSFPDLDGRFPERYIVSGTVVVYERIILKVSDIPTNIL